MSLIDDVKAANAAHTTYGQWKLTQPYVQTPRKVDMILPWNVTRPRLKFCAVCGKRIPGKNTKYCSRKCYLEGKRAEREAKNV